MSEEREEYELGEDVTALAKSKEAKYTGGSRAVHNLFDLTGRVALITGGAGHIGSAIAGALAEAGAITVLADQDGEAGERAIARITGRHHVLSTFLECDISGTGAAEGLPRLTVDLYGRLDILVNCAAHMYGPGLDVPFAEQTLETWNRSLAVNLTAPWLLAQACAPMLAASGHGSIINVASIYGMVAPDPKLYEGLGMGCGMAYAVSKAGLLHLTKCLAAELAPVRANALVPGGVARGQDAAFVERYCARVPLGRMATEQDMVGAALFLASDASAYVTGAVLPVEGGGLAQW